MQKETSEPIQTGSTNPVLLQAGNGRRPIFFVFGFGGGVDGYSELARLLGPEQTSYGLMPKGLDDGFEPDRTIPDIARYEISLMRSVQPHGPYHIAGYSLGGAIAYEIACQLEQLQEPVGLLAVIEASFEDSVRIEQSFWHPTRILGFLANLPFWMRDFLQLNRTEMLTVIIRRMMIVKKSIANRLHLNSNVTELDVIGRTVKSYPKPIIQLMVAHWEAHGVYHPPKYGGRVTVMRVRTQPLFDQKDRDYGWGLVAGGGVEVVMIPGSHSNLLQVPYVIGLAGILKERLDQAGD
jgi:thioesterase domain-containing protein